MASKKDLTNKATQAPLQLLPSPEEAELVCKWWHQKEKADNGLYTSILQGTDAIGCIKFELKGKSSQESGYSSLLCAKIFETFGVYNPGIAAAAFTECVNCIISGSDIIEMEPDEGKAFLDKHSENVLSLFQELRPRDPIELMMVTKIIILDHLSNREFIGYAAAVSDERRTMRQTRGVKLSRLFLEFKDKFDKHRKPEQQIHVQHNHIYNEGQAIIGSQLSAGGG